jgi:hypothetical protein
MQNNKDIKTRLYDCEREDLDKEIIIDATETIDEWIDDRLKFAIFESREKLLCVLFSPIINHSDMVDYIKEDPAYASMQFIWAWEHYSEQVYFSSWTCSRKFWYDWPDDHDTQVKYLEYLVSELDKLWRKWVKINMEFFLHNQEVKERFDMLDKLEQGLPLDELEREKRKLLNPSH